MQVLLGISLPIVIEKSEILAMIRLLVLCDLIAEYFLYELENLVGWVGFFSFHKEIPLKQISLKSHKSLHNTLSDPFQSYLVI